MPMQVGTPIKMPPVTRTDEVKELLNGAVDLHVHSGPAAMARTFDHNEAQKWGDEHGFKALVFKDHYVLNTSATLLLERMFPERKTKIYSGLALNNVSGGINPHAVDHAVKFGAKIIWMPTLSAKNHIEKSKSEAKNQPQAAKKLMEAEPITVLDANGKLTDDTLKVLDSIAEGDIILASGHLGVNECHIMFTEAKKRGVKKMMVNHPNYVIGCTDEDMRQLARNDVFMEFTIQQFVERKDGAAPKHDMNELKHYISLGGVERSIISSDHGMSGGPLLVDGWQRILQLMLDNQWSKSDIKALTSTNATKMLNLD